MSGRYITFSNLMSFLKHKMKWQLKLRSISMRKYLTLWPYAMASFLYYGFIGCFISYLAVYLAAKGFDSIEIGAVFAIYTIARVLFGQIVAHLSDLKQDHLSFFRLGLIGAMAFLILCLFIPNNYWFLLVIVLSLSCFMSVVSQLELLCLDAANSNTNLYNRVRFFGSLGFVICAIFIGQLLDTFSSVVVVYFGLAVLLAGYFNTKKMMNFQSQNEDKSSLNDFLNKCISPVFISFLVASILLHISFAPFVGFFTQYLSINGYQGVEVGVLFSLGAVAEMVLFLYAGFILSRFGVRNLLIFGFLISAVRWYLQGRYIDNLTIVILTQCIHAFSFGLMHSVSVHFLRRYFEPAQQGRGQFMYFGAAFGLGTAIGSWITGLTWQDGLGSQLTFTWAAIICLVGALVIWLVPNKQFIQSMTKHSSIKTN
jgi:PPP family 3-phenylpropionic acid transporter